MKSIFVATDFSAASEHAGMHAVELARHFKARLILFSAYQLPVEIPESYIFYTTEQVSKSTMAKLDTEAGAINRYGLVEIEKVVAEGSPANAILAEAKKQNADMIVCAMKGHGKMLKRLFGSTATNLARKTTIPLMIVPEDAKFELPDNILFASDMKTIPVEENIRTLKEIGAECKSKLTVVTVVDSHWHETLEFRERYLELIDQLKSMEPALESLRGSDIPAVINQYVKDHKINMVAMVPHAHGFLEGSVTKQTAFLSHVPLLLLPEKKNSSHSIEATATDESASI